jgi:hypothetical protein
LLQHKKRYNRRFGGKFNELKTFLRILINYGKFMRLKSLGDKVNDEVKDKENEMMLYVYRKLRDKFKYEFNTYQESKNNIPTESGRSAADEFKSHLSNIKEDLKKVVKNFFYVHFWWRGFSEDVPIEIFSFLADLIVKEWEREQENAAEKYNHYRSQMKLMEDKNVKKSTLIALEKKNSLLEKQLAEKTDSISLNISERIELKAILDDLPSDHPIQDFLRDKF